MLGEPAVERLEQFAEIFKILITDGLGGAWEYIKDQVGQLKDMLIEEIQNWVITEVIEAGIKWIIGLMSPVGAFIKAAMAIYDLVMFFIERGQQILDLVNAVIGAIRAIANGDTKAMSTAVEETLARMIPVAIGFLASLLGLGGISDKIRGFIDKIIKDKIMEAVRWLVNKAVDLVKRAGNWLFDGDDEDAGAEDERTPEQKQEDLDAAIVEAEGSMAVPDATAEIVREDLVETEQTYRLESLELHQTEDGLYFVKGFVNPSGVTNNVPLSGRWPQQAPTVDIEQMEEKYSADGESIGTT